MNPSQCQDQRRRFLLGCLGMSGALLAPEVLFAAEKRSQVKGVRVNEQSERTQVIFDVTKPIEHNLFTLRDPDRVVIDIKDAYVEDALDLFLIPTDKVHRVRHAKRNSQDLRVVLDLKEFARPKSFMRKADNKVGHRLIIDLPKKSAANEKALITADSYRRNSLRDVVVAIDAGHGGKDPGAVGKHGTYEKDVVLKVARQLEARLKREKGMKPVMIRTSDKYVGLRERINKAKQEKADLYISVHADASNDSRVKGSSVYVLSERGASSEEARKLAQLENSAFSIGNVDLSDKDKLLASVLIDLSKEATIEASLKLGGKMLSELNTLGRLRSRKVEQANFAVLKSLDIPSVLVETAFISNPNEEKKLRTKAHQQKLANAMLKGVRSYFEDHAPPGTFIASLNAKRA